MHSPNYEKERALARQNGGLARKYKCYFNSKIRLKTPRDIQKLIEAKNGTRFPREEKLRKMLLGYESLFND